MQDVRQQSKDKERRSGLVRLRSTKALRIWPPALPIMRLPVAGLLEQRLKRIAKVRADIHGLVPASTYFSFTDIGSYSAGWSFLV